MAEACRIPPETSIYDRIRIALNERRIWDAVVLYSQMTLSQKKYFATTYPEIHAIYTRASAEFLR